MAKLILLVGPPGSGKSTLAKKYQEEGFWRTSQDEQGKDHLFLFNQSIEGRTDIVVDRMNFDVRQRERYLKPAREAGYTTEIIVLHENYDTCLKRCLARENHPTIKDEANAKSAINTFFSKYERVEDSEADKVTRIWPESEKPECVICDLDGTLCNIEHRLHNVRVEGPVDSVKAQKKNWPKFFAELHNDTPNDWCVKILRGLGNLSNYPEIVYCSGRPDTYRIPTQMWLLKHGLAEPWLFMRNRSDSRKDSIVKEIILDFEILTRWKPSLAIDDRSQVVQMWRSRGITTLQCADGEF